MNKFKKEIIIIIIQIIMFYIYPLFIKLIGPIGMVLMILLATFILSLIIGAVSKEKIKYFYPVLVSLVFIPSVYIYYNDSALIHSVWYLVVSIVGEFLGIVISKLTNRN